MFKKAITKTFLLTTCLAILGLWASPALALGPDGAGSSSRGRDGRYGGLDGFLAAGQGGLLNEGSGDLHDAPTISGVFAPPNVAVMAETISAGLVHTCGLKTDGTVACWGSNVGEVASPPGGTFAQVSAGGWHTCGLRTDGKLACWGLSFYGAESPPGGTFTQVSAGKHHTCGVRTDGTLACWGRNDLWQADPPSGTYTQVSAGEEHTCGLRTDGTLACWGLSLAGQETPPGGTFTQVSAGYWHTCGLRTDGTLACWGYNDSGRASPPGDTFAQVSAGGEHTCGVKTDGTVDCWGWNSYGQAVPPVGGTFTQVSAGYWHTCGLRTDGTLACWGWNYHGQTNAPSGTFSQRRVSAGGNHACGLRTDGTLACWGRDNYGQVTPPGSTFTQLSAGDEHNCGLKTDGTVDCWGNNGYGRAIDPSGTFTQISAGEGHSCGLRTDGTGGCWGRDDSGQATPPVGSTFTQVSAGGFHTCWLVTGSIVVCTGLGGDGQASPPGGTFTQVSAGGYHTCGLRTDGTLACWGRDNYGQVTPPGGTFTQVSAGGEHTCGLKTDGTLACWGFNDYGQATPLGGTFTQVSAGKHHTCGVRTDGTLACWGSNSWGRAPTITVNPASLPDGQGGVAYSQSLIASGGTGPYSFAVVAGSLPPGLSLSFGGGLLSGTPISGGDYTFTVQATDANFFQGERVYTLRINFFPTDISLGNSSVAENQPGGTAVGDLTTTDPDPGDTHTYSLETTGGCAGLGTDNGAFIIAGSQLQTAAAFDYETKSSYDICVRANDGNGGTYDEPFTIDVTDLNDAPVAADDAYGTDGNTILNVVAPGVLSNDADIDGDPLTAVLDSGSVSGTLALNADGSFTYTPTLGFSGVDAFTYHANDGALDSNVATVTITARPMPDVTIVKNVTPAIAFPGQTITYTLTFSNTGSALATGVVITDVVPVSVTLPTYDASLPVTPTGSISYVWEIGDLDPGAGGVITITGQLSSTLPAGVFTNTAEIAAAVDSDPGDNLSTATVMVPGLFRSLVPGGAWHTGATWEAGSAPGPDDVVTISANSTVTVDADAQCYRLFVEEGGVLVIPAGVTLSVADGVTNQGRMQQTIDSVLSGTTTRFLHIQNPAGDRDTYLGVDVMPASDMGAVTVVIRGQQACGGPGNGGTVLRCYEISPAVSATADIIFYYRAVEGNGNTSPQVHHWNGNAWDALPSTNGGSGDALWVQATVTGYSPFALADSGNTPTSMTLLNFGVARSAPHWAGGLVGVVLLCGGVWVRRRRRFA